MLRDEIDTLDKVVEAFRKLKVRVQDLELALAEVLACPLDIADEYDQLVTCYNAVLRAQKIARKEAAKW